MGSFLTGKNKAQRAFNTLALHPNFKLPELPKQGASETEIIKFALECCAMFISPPKVPGESEEFRCQDLANAVKGPLQKQILKQVRNRK